MCILVRPAEVEVVNERIGGKLAPSIRIWTT